MGIKICPGPESIARIVGVICLPRFVNRPLKTGYCLGSRYQDGSRGAHRSGESIGLLTAPPTLLLSFACLPHLQFMLRVLLRLYLLLLFFLLLLLFLLHSLKSFIAVFDLRSVIDKEWKNKKEEKNNYLLFSFSRHFFL